MRGKGLTQVHALGGPGPRAVVWLSGCLRRLSHVGHHLPKTATHTNTHTHSSLRAHQPTSSCPPHGEHPHSTVGHQTEPLHNGISHPNRCECVSVPWVEGGEGETCVHLLHCSRRGGRREVILNPLLILRVAVVTVDGQQGGWTGREEGQKGPRSEEHHV